MSWYSVAGSRLRPRLRGRRVLRGQKAGWEAPCRSTTWRRVATTIGLALTIGLIGQTASTAQQPKALPSERERPDVMQHHFTQVSRLHEALIRGDLNAAHVAARELVRMPTPPGVPVESRMYVDAIQFHAVLVIDASRLTDAAQGLAGMLVQCGRCHESVSVRPGPSSLGGVAGHMPDHQRAVDAMLQGLVIPSASRWQEGADLLIAADVRGRNVPDGAKDTPEILAAEAAVHELASQAARASTAQERAAAYVKVTATCAQCHTAHRRTWGP